MRLLLVTTSHNAVRKVLEGLPDISLHTIDCATFLPLGKATMKTEILRAIEHVFLQDTAPDLMLTYRCPCIIPEQIFKQAQSGAFNIHPSLLPKYKGLNPWEKMFENKERLSGVTLHRLASETDSGEIICQMSFSIEPTDTIESARDKSDAIAAQMFESWYANLKNP